MSLTLEALCKNIEKKGMSCNTDDASNSLHYQHAAYCFLALLSFLAMKGNFKEALNTAREEKVRVGWEKESAET